MSNPSQVKVSCKYGAPMGRISQGPLQGPVTYSNVVLDEGYDEGGAYWGSRQGGMTLFTAWDEHGNVQYFDAKGKKGAAQHLAEEWGIDDATFVEQTWTMYWLMADCPECGEVTFPSTSDNAGTCDCGRYLDVVEMYDTEIMHYDG